MDGFGLVYRRITVRGSVVLIRVCHRHALLYP